MQTAVAAQTDTDSIPSSKEELRKLILSALQTPYLSHSCQDDIETGNSYQSVNLGHFWTPGHRTDRSRFLDQIEFRGARVLDLGSNLGELSRGARERGAILVDGFEYDRFFLETAQLINAHNNVSRVSFYQRDITDASIYGEHYDIVLAFSVWIYARRVLPKLAEITDGILVLETHRLDDNLSDVYLKPLCAYFPFYKILGNTEWLTSDQNVRRAVIVFAKTEGALQRGLALSQPAWPGRGLQIDVLKTTTWCDRFFNTFPYHEPEALLSMVRGVSFDVDALALTADLSSSPLSGLLYWHLYLKGYTEYLNQKSVSPENTYCKYLIKYFGPQGQDPGLRNILADPREAAKRVLRRFQDFDAFRKGSPEALAAVPPVQLLMQATPTPDAKVVYTLGPGKPVIAGIDGYHRLFLARLFAVKTLPATTVDALLPTRTAAASV